MSGCVALLSVYNVILPDAVTLGGADEGGGASPLGLQGHLIYRSGR